MAENIILSNSNSSVLEDFATELKQEETDLGNVSSDGFFYKPKQMKFGMEVISETGWKNVREQREADFFDIFADAVAIREAEGNVDFSVVNYEIYDEDWYRMKYPHFDDDWYALLAEASRKKFDDLRKTKEPIVPKEPSPEDFTIKFD